MNGFHHGFSRVLLLACLLLFLACGSNTVTPYGHDDDDDDDDNDDPGGDTDTDADTDSDADSDGDADSDSDGDTDDGYKFRRWRCLICENHFRAQTIE